ncbi:MAG: hydrogenase maturation protease [Acidobacteriaceae bacterium]|nr:hydrogenase maturation protease [Acidobacteriaceae bacterium]
MSNILQQLEPCLRGRICFLGLGNTDYGDDGFGVRLAEKLVDAGVADVIVAGTTPERWITQLSGFDHVVFLDAVDFGGAPGDAAFLNSAEMAARFPQISTHKISLGLLARWIEANGRTKASVLGVQPERLQSPQLSSTVQNSLDALCEVITATAQSCAAAPRCPEQALVTRMSNQP